MLAYSLTFSVTVFMIVFLILESFRKSIAGWFFKFRSRFWILLVIILALYCIITIACHSWHFKEFAIIAVYFFLPTYIMYRMPSRFDVASEVRLEATLFDIVLILLIWLPLEFEFVPTQWITVIGFLWPLGVFVTVIYILILLTGWRRIELSCPGNLSFGTFVKVGIAYLILSILILPCGMKVGFINPGLNVTLVGRPILLLFAFLGIFFAVAIPEEILFRGWIQSLLMTRMKFLPGLATSAVIFGLSHVDDKVITLTKVFDIPNWWYAFFATIAGAGYGYIYHKRKSIFASALLHTLVDFTWILFFAG